MLNLIINEDNIRSLMPKLIKHLSKPKMIGYKIDRKIDVCLKVIEHEFM